MCAFCPDAEVRLPLLSMWVCGSGVERVAVKLLVTLRKTSKSDLTSHFLTICWASEHLRRLGPDMEQHREPRNRIISIERVAEKDGLRMLKQAGVAAE